MLVLSRKKNQSIVIDGGIEIQILQLKGGTVKIGINAPNDVRIVRGELEVYPEVVAMGSEEKESEDYAAIPATVKLNEVSGDYFVERPLAGKVMAK